MASHVHLASNGMQCIGAYVAQPETTPLGGIVVVQEIFGVNAHIRSVADRFAAHGYMTIAPAFFDHLETGVELDYDAEGVTRGRALVDALNLDTVMADVASAADAIRSAGRIAVVGYCWGGTIALLAASRLGLPAVSYYGARNVAHLDEGNHAPLQFHFGSHDASIPAEAIERHREAFPDSGIFVYPCGHGFNCDQRKDHDEVSATLALERTLRFLERNIGGGHDRIFHP